MSKITNGIRRFWRDSRDWSLLWQLGIAVLVILLGALVAAAISDALYGTGSAKSARPTSTRTDPDATVLPTPQATVTVVTRPTTSTTSASSLLLSLTIGTPSHRDTYNRAANFGGWIDVEGCKDTRAVLLIRTSRSPVTFTRSSECTVKTGRWTDPWSGVTTTVAHEFQIDHTVPLANAWRSGAWAWTHERRVAFANDLTDAGHLVPILASENASKSDRGPDEWKPPDRSTWCRYALLWDRIKAKWNLIVTRAEWNTLVAMAATC